MAIPQKVKSIDRIVDRLCPWCERNYRAAKEHVGQFCPECHAKLMGESTEFLVDMLGKAVGLNVIIMSALPVSPEILQKVEMLDSAQRGSGRRLTMQEVAAQTEGASTVGLGDQMRPSQPVVHECLKVMGWHGNGFEPILRRMVLCGELNV